VSCGKVVRPGSGLTHHRLVWAVAGVEHSDTRKQTKPREPPKPWPERVSWNVYYEGKVGRWIGTVEAESGEAAIARAAERFGYQPSRLLVIKRR
jgi:hypothetical protein